MFLIFHKYFRHIEIKDLKVWRKNLLWFGFYEKDLDGEVNIPLSPGIGLKATDLNFILLFPIRLACKNNNENTKTVLHHQVIS